MSSVLVFAANDGGIGTETWLTSLDGTSVTPVDLNVGVGGSNPFNAISYGDYVYFSADDGIAGRELFRSDGTVSGTVRVADSNFGPADFNPSNMAVIGDSLYFRGVTVATGNEPYTVTTTSTPMLLRDVYPGATSSTPLSVHRFQRHRPVQRAGPDVRL